MKKVKKPLVLLLALCVLVTLCSCGTDNPPPVESTALYVDGAFVGAVADSAALQALLEELKSAAVPANEQGMEIKEQSVSFLQTVECKTEMHEIENLKTIEQMRALLTAEVIPTETYTVQLGDAFSAIAQGHDLTADELLALNPDVDPDGLAVDDVLIIRRGQPHLQVQVVWQVSYTEEIPYSTATTYRSDKAEDYYAVITEGENGSKDVTAEITYVDGYEIDRVSEEIVTKQAVSEEVEIGRKIDVNWTWPVPSCHNVYLGYNSSHKAIDVSPGSSDEERVNGKSVVAVDAGTVIEASTGWNDGYGTIAKVRHSNGLITVYAHLDSLSISVGQTVSAGQEIGKVGNTGRSSGPHLHFEVIRNGVKVNPLNYVQP